MAERLAIALLVLVPACFDPATELRGKPCSGEASCGSLHCEYGFCGGPERCKDGAGVGDFCFSLGERSFAVGSGPSTLGVGLVDADPRFDVVVGNADSGTLSLLLNDGAGAFAPAIESAALGDVVHELVIGHVDDSGFADVVATTEQSSLMVVPILRGDGGASFAAPTIAASGLVAPTRPRVGDFVDDPLATPDVAALVAEGLDVRRQDAALTFTGDLLTAVEGASDIRLLGQGMERAYIAAKGDRAVVSCSRNPDGTFSPRKTIDVGAAPAHLVLEDFNHDDYSDLLTVSDEGEVWLTRGKDVGLDAWHMPQQVYDIGFTPSQVAAANLDDDDALELVVAGGASGGRRDLYLFDNDGDGRPIYGGSLGLDDAAAAVLADLEPDGVPELVIVDAAAGHVRIARRTVAPPPVGDESTTAVDPSSPEVTGNPTDPSDPSAESGDTFPGTSEGPSDETGTKSCGADMQFGLYCYAHFADYFAPSGTLVYLEMGDVTGDFIEDVVFADAFGGVFLLQSESYEPPAYFMQPDAELWTLPAVPTGLTIHWLDESYIGKVIVTHDAGISVRGFDVMFGGADTQPADLILGPATNPRSEQIFGTGLPQIAFEHDGKVAFVDDIASGNWYTAVDTVGPTDLELVPLGILDYQYAVVAATSSGLVPYLLSPGMVTAAPPLESVGPQAVIGTSWGGYITGSDGTTLSVTHEPAPMMLQTDAVGDGAGVGDFEFGDFDGDFYLDFVALVELGSDNAALHFYLQRPNPEAGGLAFDGPIVVSMPYLAGVAVRNSWTAEPPELVIADVNGSIQHLVPEYLQ
ncbi:MAG TPA: hypothetical protein VG755_06480 [Nannocystaceae bacterium]|nr:hypothetical protein [Nannocystaceae bacterium]